MAKIKSFITEAEVGIMSNPEIEFVSLVGHAANRQPFKIIKGEIKGGNEMPKTIYNVLVSKDVSEDRLQEIASEHSFSVDEKLEDAVEGFDVYSQIEDGEVDLETRKMTQIEDGIYAVVADLKEESEAEAIEKEMEYESLDGVADATFAMADIVLGVLRQPEADDMNRKEMIMSAISNFSNYAGAVLSTAKAEDVLAEINIKSEIIKEQFAQEALIDEAEENLKSEIISDVDALIEEKTEAKFAAIMAKAVEGFNEKLEALKSDLNLSLNSQFELVSKKEDVEKTVAELKTEIETVKNTPKPRNSEINETKNKAKLETKKKNQSFVTFV